MSTTAATPSVGLDGNPVIQKEIDSFSKEKGSDAKDVKSDGSKSGDVKDVKG